VRAGETVGYNATWTAHVDTEVAIINLGYADGLFRGFSGNAYAHGHDTVLPMLGRISMDLTAVDVSALPAIVEGNLVGIAFSLPGAAAASAHSQYELLTMLGRRYERMWH
jgi:alanine racemase